MRATGWMLDASIDRHQHALTLWIKRDGKTRGYTYHGFKPSVFVYTDLLTDSEWTEGRILRTIGEHPSVVHSQIVQRFVDVYDLEQKPVIQVFT
ncbi:hypothetical protein EU538_11400, partial [Candidatus Thorarchaeota archaeon]